MKLHEAKKIATEKFSASHIAAVRDTPALDADLLMAHATGFDRAEIILHRNDELTAEQEQIFFAAVAKRETGFPVAYITGHKEFFGLDFIVTPDVLIPKPDTEILVEKTLETIHNLQLTIDNCFSAKNQNTADIAQNKNANSQLKICDVCTGSGCVGISVIHNLESEHFQFSMTDISEAALNVAQKNAELLLSAKEFANTKFLQGDLLGAVDGAELFDIIVSNPPYIPSGMVDELLQDGRSEPRLALDGDANSSAADGLAIIRRLVPQAFTHLRNGGYFLCETGEYNAREAAEIFKAAGFAEIKIFDDLAGMPRVVCGKKHSPRCSGLVGSKPRKCG